MIYIDNYKTGDLDCVKIQPEQEAEKVNENGLLRVNAKSIKKNGKVLCVFWITDLGGGRSMVSSLISQDCGRFMYGMKLAFNKYIAENYPNVVRFESTVKTDFDNAHRMIKLLGFIREGTMRKFYNNENYDLYARVK